ncbi:TetR/AcrR family transcriptional regulator [Pseudomonas sp. MAFF 302030]|uniref:TetR/AcrR family transcriptional regulator n=1 Tax=Pseudomonas morbosilactucae TaxID=2938197 RepID=A0A9X1YVL3_9PSED|nr:TetR/AcrR family transcriptional regulator [Pseudomonas morbosilactucae]MCK9798912.1 TetR/AcrR family transcriptional regulator [Pseudomonas morbosilactucae]
MRTKSEARRTAILTAAGQIFHDQGFDGASMAQIALSLGCSKATLYSYFESKEVLFYEALMAAAGAQMRETFAAIENLSLPIAESLQSLGEQVISLLYSEEVMAVRRLLLSAAGRKAGLGKACYDAGPAQFLEVMSSLLKQYMDEGLLRKADPQVAALHLRALLESEWLDLFLFSTMQGFDQTFCKETASRATQTFLAAYGTD